MRVRREGESALVTDVRRCRVVRRRIRMIYTRAGWAPRNTGGFFFVAARAGLYPAPRWTSALDPILDDHVLVGGYTCHKSVIINLFMNTYVVGGVAA